MPTHIGARSAPNIPRAVPPQVNQLWRKINELDIEKQEHGLVLSALQPMDDSRKCFRLIGDVLVERTVGEVAPAVSRNQDGIAQLIDKLQEQLSVRKKVMSEFQAKYKIQVKGQGGQETQQGQAQGSQGVLVGES